MVPPAEELDWHHFRRRLLRNFSLLFVGAIVVLSLFYLWASWSNRDAVADKELEVVAATVVAKAERGAYGRVTVKFGPKKQERLSHVTGLQTFVYDPVKKETLIEHPAGIMPEAPYELVERMRASIVVLGPLLARFGRARVALPGGDDFGPRPIDMHRRGLEQLGASFEHAHGYIEARADQLVGTSILLEFPSVGATENALMAAVLARGRTVIDNAAREPEITDLAAFLSGMGARIECAHRQNADARCHPERVAPGRDRAGHAGAVRMGRAIVGCDIAGRAVAG